MTPILTILEPEHFSPVVMERLKEHFAVVAVDGATGGEVLWTRLRRVDLANHPHAKLIACNCTDVSHLPLAECERRGIEILSLKGIEGLDNVHATAEHTISLMLQALRHRCDRSSWRIGRELRGKSIGLVGYGRIARQVERMLDDGFHAMPERCDHSMFKPNWWKYDIVSIHASLNETSKGMVNAEFLSKLKPGCILVNTARHAIVDYDAVCGWLASDSNAIYAHDFAEEWSCEKQKHEVINLGDFRGQVIGTPHIGGWTIESLHKTEELLAEKVIEWAKQRMEVSV